MKNSLFLAILLGSSVSFAANSIVKCNATIDGKKVPVSIKLNSKGRITAWDSTKYVLASKGSMFGIFLDVNGEDSDVEYLHVIRDENGYDILQAGNSAAEVLLGLSPDRTTGFLKIRDIGSGSGNSEYPMTCKELKK